MDYRLFFLKTEGRDIGRRQVIGEARRTSDLDIGGGILEPGEAERRPVTNSAFDDYVTWYVLTWRQLERTSEDLQMKWRMRRLMTNTCRATHYQWAYIFLPKQTINHEMTVFMSHKMR